MSQTRSPPCPICGRPAAPPGERSPRPFCTSRCQMVDLGRWFGEAYVIAGAPAPDAEAEALDPDPDALDLD